MHMRCGGCVTQSRLTTPLGKTRQGCWQDVHNRWVKYLAERLDLFALRAVEAEGIDLLFLEPGDQLVGFAGRRERPGDEAVGLAPLGGERRGAVEQAAGLALDPAPIELERVGIAAGGDLDPVAARVDRSRRRGRARRLLARFAA